MTVEKITASLLAWQNAMRECEDRMSQIAEVVGTVVESSLGGAVFGLMGAYTRAVAEQIGWCDDVLEAWWCEHEFGGKPMMIGFPGEELRTVDSVEALAQFIADDLARAKL